MVNDMVLSVNEIADGTAVTAVADISNELEKLRKTAHALGLPSPDSINWTLIVSSTSDSAATQKRINKLIEERRQTDEERFGCATIETFDLVENFCSMHLGVNLRKAFLSGMASDNEIEGVNNRKYHRVETLVHEFCKLLGTHGVPEYTLGGESFPDFLMLKSSSSNEQDCSYYQSCLNITLHRQVGSRCFVSAANACKVLFLKDVAIKFLRFTGKDAGNKLEREVFA